jgi:hypothetical protein
MPLKSDLLHSSQLFFFAMLFDPDMGVQHIRTYINGQSGVTYLTQFTSTEKRLKDVYRFKRILDAVYEETSGIFDQVLKILASPAHQQTNGMSLVFQKGHSQELILLCKTWEKFAIADYAKHPE